MGHICNAPMVVTLMIVLAECSLLSWMDQRGF